MEGSRFPDARSAPADAPAARGGDLEPDTLLDAYRHGFFPWPASVEGWGGPRGATTLWWWSPDPRGVMVRGGFHVSRSLRRTLRSSTLRWSIDASFDEVVAACADRPGEGTWITPEMRDAYGRLHRMGAAHSVEVWADDRLVGGVYGVAVGGVFSGESMFHRADDASKVAVLALTEALWAGGFVLLDVQLWTPHLGSLGAVEVDRDLFLDVLHRAPPGRLGPRQRHPVADLHPVVLPARGRGRP